MITKSLQEILNSAHNGQNLQCKEFLTLTKDSKPIPTPSSIDWSYWMINCHIAEDENKTPLQIGYYAGSGIIIVSQDIQSTNNCIFREVYGDNTWRMGSGTWLSCDDWGPFLFEVEEIHFIPDSEPEYWQEVA